MCNNIVNVGLLIDVQQCIRRVFDAPSIPLRSPTPKIVTAHVALSTVYTV